MGDKTLVAPPDVRMVDGFARFASCTPCGRAESGKNVPVDLTAPLLPSGAAGFGDPLFFFMST